MLWSDEMNQYSHLEDYIKSFYTQMKIDSPELLDMKSIARQLEIKLFYWEEKSQAILYEDMSAIFIDCRSSPEMQWQDFMHELCHVLIHTGDQIYMSPLFREYQEFKANNFMYHACVPTFMLDNHNIYDNTLENARLIQELFHVEGKFAIKRLNQYLQNRQSILKWNRDCTKY